MRNIILTTMISTMALSACSPGFKAADERMQRSVEDVDLGLARFGETDIRSGGVQLSDRPFVAAQRERNNAATRLPARVQASNAVHLQSRDQMGLADIAARLSEISGIPHALALGPTGRMVSSVDIPRTVDDAGAAEALRSAAVRELTETGSPANRIQIRPNLRGPLSAVLDEVASAFELEWTYSEGRVIFRDFVTRQYQVSALPFTETASAELSNNNLSASSQATSDVWSEIAEAIENMLSEGSNVAFGRSTGTITVTGRIGDHSRVGEYIRATNERVGQQVAFDVNVLTVVLNNQDAFGIDLSAAIARSGYSVDILGRPQSGQGIGSVNIGITQGNVDIRVLARALSQYGRVSVETRAGTTTANNRVAPIEVVDEVAYLREIRIEESASGERERITRSTDTATTGFQMQLMPRIMNTRDIMVQYAVRISELNNLRTFGDGVEAVQLPEISTTAFQQQAVIQNGQTLIMAGFERRRVERDHSNGGELLRIARSDASNMQRVATVLLITPTIVRR